MPRVKLNELDAFLEAFSYPVERDALAGECEDVTLVLADGETNAGDLLRASSVERFTSREDVFADLMSRLPRNAVGEPFQSEGEG